MISRQQVQIMVFEQITQGFSFERIVQEQYVQYIALCIATDDNSVERGAYHRSGDGDNSGKRTTVTHGIGTRREMSVRDT